MSPESKDVPTKYGNLVRARDLVHVPPVLLLDAEFFARELEGYQQLARDVERSAGEMRATAGSALPEHHRALARVVDGARLRTDVTVRLQPRIEEVFGKGALERESLAVRSSAHGEDGATRSYAGLYESVLDVCGAGELVAAIERVWRSYFSYPALLERLHAGRLDAAPGMSVLVQRMVRARHAGVAFTRDPVSGSYGPVIELVAGLGDALVSGRQAARTIAPSDVVEGELATVVTELRATLARLEPRFGAALDVEWGWDGERLQVLQIRQMTTGPRAGRRSSTAVFHALPLFDASDEELAPFQPLDEFAAYIRRKRGPLFRHGRSVGAPSGAALLVQCNREGLVDGGHSTELLRTLRSDEVIIDSGQHLRQHIVPRSRLAGELAAVCARAGEIHQLVLRDFIRGSHGLISRRLDDGAVFCELSSEGLLALNRGTAEGTPFRIVDGESAGPLPANEAQLIARATVGAQRALGPCQLEWVIASGRAHLVDYSPQRDVVPGRADGKFRVIGHGFARGPSLHVREDDYLWKMSEGPAVSLTGIPDVAQLDDYFQSLVARIREQPAPPVIFCARPFAILAVLIPFVSGFVFESASTLCHLAILIREHALPAVEAPSLEASPGAFVTVDTRAPNPVLFDGVAHEKEAS